MIDLDEMAGVVTGRHIRIENGVVKPAGMAFSWWISPKMKEVALEKGDIIRVNADGGVPLIVVEDVFSQLPEDMKSPRKSTIEFFAKAPPPDMNWPPTDKEYREMQRIKSKNRRKNEKKKKPEPRSFRERLKHALEYRSLRYQKVSELAGMGIDTARIRKWAKGTDTPSPERIQGMARALDVSPEWLAGEEDKPLAFNDKLRQNLLDRKMTRKKLGKALDIPVADIFQYTTGAQVPTIKLLKKMAKKLKIPALELTDANVPQGFPQRFQFLLDEHGLSYKSMAKLLKLPRENISKYATGTSVPSPKIVRKMSEVLEVSPEWLAGNQ